MKKIWLLCLSIPYWLAACTGGSTVSPTPFITSGIELHVLEGPMCPGPVQVGAGGCPDKPYQAEIQVLNSSGEELTRFLTDAGGYYKLALAPGDYTLHPIPGKPLPHAADQTVTVEAGVFIQVTITYDTGMR